MPGVETKKEEERGMTRSCVDLHDMDLFLCLSRTVDFLPVVGGQAKKGGGAGVCWLASKLLFLTCCNLKDIF